MSAQTPLAHRRAVASATAAAAKADAEPAHERTAARVPAIRVAHLSKSYGTRKAVDDVSLEVPAGVIAGVVGPNGAGKTTTMRMLLSLIEPTAGSVEVLGMPASRPSAYLPRVGSMIEGPAFYPNMSARRNLEILVTLGGIGSDRIDPLLEQVGLQGRGDDQVKSYSLGMRQRLGIAAALLPDPALLILDEPSNGLDPAGILEIRQLLQNLKQTGVTVLVSSHLLSEVEQVADWIILLKLGRVVYQGWMADLLARRQSALIVGASNPDELRIVAAVARKQRFESEILDHGGQLRVKAPTAAAGALNRAAMEAGVVLTEIYPERTSLEGTFFALTEGAA